MPAHFAQGPHIQMGLTPDVSQAPRQYIQAKMRRTIPDARRHGRPSRSRRARPTRALWVSVLAIGILATTAATASATTAQEEREGTSVLRELEGGTLDCSEASAEDFEHVGDYAMGRTVGSPGGHEAMDAAMTRMMGEEGNRQAHVAMGRRYAGCGRGPLPAGFGRMMTAVNGMGVMGGFEEGGGPRDYGHGESMMGDGWEDGAGHDHVDGPSAAAMIGVMAVLIAAAALAVYWLGRRRGSRPDSPLQILQRRYAGGELSDEQYRERRRLLEGG